MVSMRQFCADCGIACLHHRGFHAAIATRKSATFRWRYPIPGLVQSCPAGRHVLVEPGSVPHSAIAACSNKPPQRDCSM
eukprot:363725-Chlamydomonas_euryale.AAC.15